MSLPPSPSSGRLPPSLAASSTCVSSTTATGRRSPAGRSTTSPTAAAREWCCGSTSSPRHSRASTPERRAIALTPQGRQLDQGVVEELAGEGHLTLLSARFEGFDERILMHLANDAISIGPYVLSGGELPAMVVLDAIARRLPGALAEGSGAEESFSFELEGRYEYPHYTRPPEFRGWAVPEVLLSGDHGRIADWRRSESRARTPS